MALPAKSLVVLLLLAAPVSLLADTLVVLPFYNASVNSPGLDWIGESIADTLRETLAAEGLLVLERESRQEAYRRLAIRPGALLTHASVIKIGQVLDASQVIFGEFTVAPAAPLGPPSRGSLRIVAYVLDLKRLKRGPELVEMGALEDLSALDRRLAWQSLQFLAPRTAPPEEEFRRKHPSIRADALESHVRGLLAATPEQKHRLFTQAARLDPAYSQPKFQLGRMLAAGKEYRVAAGWLEGVSRNDAHYYEARFLLGLCRYHSADYAGAENAFQEVAAAVPLNEVWNNLAVAQSRRNNPAAAANFRKAVEGDNTDPDYHFNLGYVLWKSGDFDGAAAAFKAVLDRTPGDAETTTLLARATGRSGPRPGETQTVALERVKSNYEETAYRQLQAELQPKK
jgi:tetratricopeptide (TPR) repeat protein